MDPGPTNPELEIIDSVRSISGCRELFSGNLGRVSAVIET